MAGGRNQIFAVSLIHPCARTEFHKDNKGGKMSLQICRGLRVAMTCVWLSVALRAVAASENSRAQEHFNHIPVPSEKHHSMSLATDSPAGRVA